MTSRARKYLKGTIYTKKCTDGTVIHIKGFSAKTLRRIRSAENEYLRNAGKGPLPKMAIIMPGGRLTDEELNAQATKWANTHWSDLGEFVGLGDNKVGYIPAEGITCKNPDELSVISPLGPRTGPGTFDTFFDTVKYKTMEAALAAHDYVVVNFVANGFGTKSFEAYHSKEPHKKAYVELEIQHFPFGIDMRDDQAACNLAVELLEFYKDK